MTAPTPSISAALATGKTSLPQMQALFDAAAGKPVSPAIVVAAVIQFPLYAINTPARAAEFIAQIAHETGGFTTFEENLRYSAAGMLATWPTHFTKAQAEASVGKPSEVASRAYGGRMGNAPYPSQDGYTYRGRGMLQLTGKNAYAVMGTVLKLDLLNHPELALEPRVSLQIACEFCKRNSFFEAVDAGNFAKARKIVNGGTLGLDDVAARRARVLKVIG